jgi:hypothetical protein
VQLALPGRASAGGPPRGVGTAYAVLAAVCVLLLLALMGGMALLYELWLWAGLP